MRNFKYVKTIKEAIEKECPSTVSCADIVALSARDGIVLVFLIFNFFFNFFFKFLQLNPIHRLLNRFQLGGPRVEMKTGRKDSKTSYLEKVEKNIPNHNDSISSVLSAFESIGVDIERTVALLGI